MAENNIAGIHNYCDRWCERCDFRHRCSVYEQEQSEEAEDGGKPENDDEKAKLFFDRLSQNFSKAKTMLEDIAEKAGVDLEALSSEIEKTEEQRQENKKKAREHSLVTLAMEYAQMASAWLKTQPGMMEKLEAMKEELTLGIESQAQAREDMQMIKDSLAVIEWYSYFIHQKLSRALMSKMQMIEWEEDLTDPQTDFNGSAKVALMATARSKDAWIKIFNLLPEQEDHFLKVLGKLEKIEKEIALEFPECHKFVRPGFDEPQQ
jgi:hypothetical protein